MGNVFSGVDEAKREEFIKENIINNGRCINCKHIFFCTGPCLAQKVYTGEDRRVYCQHFDKILLEAVKKYRNEKKIN